MNDVVETARHYWQLEVSLEHEDAFAPPIKAGRPARGSAMLHSQDGNGIAPRQRFAL
jgi:hypothetical protein